MPLTEQQERNFWRKVLIGDDCWEWTASRVPDGYGQFQVGMRNPKRAHRIAYELLVGSIPEGLTIDHLCRNRGCVNPAHLEPVTMGENNRRGRSPSANNARKTHCPRGHPLSGDNLYVYNGGRTCLICRRKATREWMAARIRAAGHTCPTCGAPVSGAGRYCNKHKFHRLDALVAGADQKAREA